MDALALGPTLPRIAREAIAAHLRGAGTPPISGPAGEPAGVFVTLRNADGSLRGCIGSITPSQPTLVAETLRSAVLAATRDPRFPPVRLEELPALGIEVSVLAPATPVRDVTELDPARYGVIMEDDHGRRGLLLPAIEGVDDVEVQLAIVRRKAGISEGVPVRLSRFIVEKWTDASPAPM